MVIAPATEEEKMTNYAIMEIRLVEDLCGDDDYVGSHYQILKKVPVQTDLYKNVPDKWLEIYHYTEWTWHTPTLETKTKIAHMLMKDGFREEDSLAVGYRRVYHKYDKSYWELRSPPQYEECNFEKEMRKIIAGG
jgi:hypothetical protein